MFLSNFSIRQPVTTIAIVIVLMCPGLLALVNLRVNQRPDVEMPIKTSPGRPSPSTCRSKSNS